MAKQTFTTGQVLTAAQMTSLQQTAMLGGAASAKTASYTLVAADAGTAITMNNASATTITVNTALFAAGDTVQITNLGAGVCTITAGTATVNTSASLALAQYESGTLDFTSTSSAIFIKGAGAAAASGGMTLISTTSLTGASVTLSSIPQTYVSLYLVMSGLTNATGNGANRLAFNAVTNLTSTIGVYSISVSTRNNGRLELSDGSSTLRTDANNIFVVQIDNYTSSSSYKTGLTRGSILDSSSSRIQFNYSYVFASNTALTSIVIDNSGGNLSTGTALLYGVK